MAFRDTSKFNAGFANDADNADERRATFRRTLKAMPGYPWLPCPICVREGFKGVDGCDHIAAERARASGILFGTGTVQ